MTVWDIVTVMTLDALTLPQIIGYIALLTYWSGYAVKDDNKLKIIFSLSNLFWIAHYWMIGAHTAAVTTIIVTARNMLSLNAQKFSGRRRLVTVLIFSLLLVVATLFTWDGWPSVLALAGTLGFTYAGLYLHGIRLRAACMAADIIWLVHAILVGSQSGLIYAVGALIVNAVTMVRMRQDARYHGNDKLG